MYGSPVVWEPYALAVVLGLVVSAAIYFVVMWPQVEPDDNADEDVVPEDSRERPADSE